MEQPTWAKMWPFGQRCEARKANDETGYFGRCELEPHSKDIDHALVRGSVKVCWKDGEVRRFSPEYTISENDVVVAGQTVTVHLPPNTPPGASFTIEYKWPPTVCGYNSQHDIKVTAVYAKCLVEDCNWAVLHPDMKSTPITLDESMQPNASILSKHPWPPAFCPNCKDAFHLSVSTQMVSCLNCGWARNRFPDNQGNIIEKKGRKV